jgi:hypothetical protein
MKKSSKCYTCYGMCYCDCTPMVMYDLPSYQKIYISQNIINMACGKKKIVLRVTILEHH